MQQEIKYGTFSASPDDYLVPDGELAAMGGLERKGGALYGALPREEMFSLNGRTLLCQHVTSAFKHYIVRYGDVVSWLDEDGNNPDGGGVIHDFTGAEIIKVEPIGNTLVILASDGIHYALWKKGEYVYLGTKMPELDLRFELTNGKAYESDEHKVDWDSSGYDDIFDDLYTPFWWFDSDEQVSSGASVGRDIGNQLRQAIMASLNQVAAKPSKEKMFAFPFFVRYGYRLYDGSITMHSAPALMIPTLVSPTVAMGWAGISNDRQGVDHPAKVKASLSAYKLHCKPLDMGQVDALAQWSDIITSVDVFVSPQFYTYNQAAKDDDIELKATVTAPTNSMLKSQITDNGTFFLLKQARLSASMPQSSTLLQSGGGIVEGDYETMNENIVVRELMSDDSGTHDELTAKKSFAYNGRINLAGVSKKLFSGFNPGCMWCNAGDTMSNTTTATVVIEADGREIVVRSDEGVVFYKSSRSSSVFWFFYPNTGARRAHLTLDGKDLELELIPHPTLNGAYYCSIDEDAVQRESSVVPSPSSDEERIVEQPNKVYTSDVYNPFYFPSSGINTVGTGEILGICAAVKALSQGQFGQFPLYAFTTEGVWALQTTSEGGYAAVQPVTRDVCVDADSITQMDSSVLYATSRGIMVISGSDSQCMSDALDGRSGFSLSMMTEKSNAIKLLVGDPAVTLEMVAFERFREGMRMMYDYRHQRVIVYNDTMHGTSKAYPYAYVFSLESQRWSVTMNDLTYHINSYPDAIAVTKNGEVVNLSNDTEPSGRIPFVLLTRPLDLGLPNVYKTVRDVIQRGVFVVGHVQQVLFGSTDLLHWHIVGSSQNGYLRGYSGTPYKWFRLMLFGSLDKDESIAGATVQFEPALTNQVR